MYEYQEGEICRVCLGIYQNLQSIFCCQKEGSPHTLQVSEMITTVAQVQILPNEGLPEVICATCIIEAFHAYEFKQKCKNSDLFLRHQLDTALQEEKPQLKTEELEISETKIEIEIKPNVIQETELEVMPDVIQETDEIEIRPHFGFINAQSVESKDVSVCQTKSLIQMKDSLNPNKAGDDTCSIIIDAENQSGEDDHLNQKHSNPTKKAKDSAKKDFFCNICLKEFESQLLLNRHVSNHRTYKCEICGKGFQLGSGLRSHLKTHNGTRSAYNLRSTCGKALKRFKTIKEHMSIVTGEKPYERDVCKKKFTKSEILSQHKRSTHPGVCTYTCSTCKKAFKRPDALIRHMRVHTGEKPYECDVCKKKFSDSGNLLRHKKLHTGDKQFKCNFCKKAFAERGSLKTHLQIHTGEKPHECDVCQKTFLESRCLIQHKWVHTGVKQFECSICKKAFAKPRYLKTHMRIHTGVKPHECDVCKKKFLESRYLIQHKWVHTGVKPFECGLCKKAFAKPHSLKVHMRIHTGEKHYECDVCKMTFLESRKLSQHKWIHTGVKQFKSRLNAIFARRRSSNHIL